MPDGVCKIAVDLGFAIVQHLQAEDQQEWPGPLQLPYGPVFQARRQASAYKIGST